MLGQFNKKGVLCMLLPMPLVNRTHKGHKVTRETNGDSRRKLPCLSLDLLSVHTSNQQTVQDIYTRLSNCRG